MVVPEEKDGGIKREGWWYQKKRMVVLEEKDGCMVES